MEKETEIQKRNEEERNYFLNTISKLENNVSKAKKELVHFGQRLLEDTNHENLIVDTSGSQLTFLDEENGKWVWPEELIDELIKNENEDS